jgi:hypothetical protein
MVCIRSGRLVDPHSIDLFDLIIGRLLRLLVSRRVESFYGDCLIRLNLSRRFRPPARLTSSLASNVHLPVGNWGQATTRSHLLLFNRSRCGGLPFYHVRPSPQPRPNNVKVAPLINPAGFDDSRKWLGLSLAIIEMSARGTTRSRSEQPAEDIERGEENASAANPLKSPHFHRECCLTECDQRKAKARLRVMTCRGNEATAELAEWQAEEEAD